ncbi:TonB-dependent receptor [Janthinobacterium fluminis]|uniref:TonB-dependent receptor plug domain-containing protein n=1 Tax=Janthinobacterium fluminis TaxID=2987524 RepID=A0ABT5JZP2_9BURK|nr:TonB-dependent receptor [Janthinobacterium fluminis]MDC8758206.1 TonB-dependent receptor plug domain-containing protein [Janthinobacterium fluminis]
MHSTLKMSVLAASIAAALSCQFALAAEAPVARTLPEVLVNGKKIDANKIEADKKVATGDSAGLLRDIPGISMYGAGGVSSLPAIHGLADDRLRVQVNGMDLISACANHMNPALSYIDPSQIDSIEVLSGITPVSAGGDSIGGTIRVKSAEPEFAAAGQGPLLKGQAGVFFRSNGSVRGANASATLANETVSVNYSGSTIRSGNYKAARDFKPAGLWTGTPHAQPADEVGSSRYESQNQSLGVALRSGQHLLELKVGLQNIPHQGYPNQRMDMTGNDSEQFNLRYHGRYQWGELEARAYREHTRHVMNFGHDKQFWYGAKGTVPGMPMDTEGTNHGGALKAELNLSARDLVRVGGDYQRYRLSDWWSPSGGGMAPNTFWNINDGQRDRFAVYAEWDARWNAQWFSQIGVRGEAVTMNAGKVQGYNTTMANYAAESAAFNGRDRLRKDHNLDLVALARYTPDRDATYEFGYARKTRSPNLHERYTWSTGGMPMNMVNTVGDGNGYVGDMDLKPETAHTLSATADWHDVDQEKWGVKVTPYYTYVQDYVDARCLAKQCPKNAFVFLRYVNQNARLYGLDLSGHVALAKSAGYGNINASGVLSYVNGSNRVTGDRLYNIMPLNAKLALVQSVAAWTNTVEVQLVSAKKDISEVRNELKTAGYGLLNLRSSYAWKQAQFDFGVENALNRFYDSPLGGAYAGQGTTMSQKGIRYGIAVPGMGRSIYAGMTVKF